MLTSPLFAYRVFGRSLITIYSPQLLRLRLRLLQPEPHVHVAIHRRRGGEVSLSLLPLAVRRTYHRTLCVWDSRACTETLPPGAPRGVWAATVKQLVQR